MSVVPIVAMASRCAFVGYPLFLFQAYSGCFSCAENIKEYLTTQGVDRISLKIGKDWFAFKDQLQARGKNIDTPKLNSELRRNIIIRGSVSKKGKKRLEESLIKNSKMDLNDTIFISYNQNIKYIANIFD